MDCALRQGAQLLSLAPEFVIRSFWEKVVLPASSLLLLTLYPIRLMNNPRASRAIAAEAFILMRAEDLKALGTCGVSSLVYLPFLIVFRVPPLYVFTLPLAVVFYSAAALNSVLATVVGGGVAWTDRRSRWPERKVRPGGPPPWRFW